MVNPDGIQVLAMVHTPPRLMIPVMQLELSKDEEFPMAAWILHDLRGFLGLGVRIGLNTHGG